MTLTPIYDETCRDRDVDPNMIDAYFFVLIEPYDGDWLYGLNMTQLRANIRGFELGVKTGGQGRTISQVRLEMLTALTLRYMIAPKFKIIDTRNPEGAAEYAEYLDYTEDFEDK